ncbi:50S ribosomal protein L20, partial sequence, partial [Candidatus Phytoplasma solani]
RDRKQRKRDFRKLWISRINAGATALGIQYSRLMHGLVLAKVDVNRKVLADLAHQQPEVFADYVQLAKVTLEQFHAELKVQQRSSFETTPTQLTTPIVKKDQKIVKSNKIAPAPVKQEKIIKHEQQLITPSKTTPVKSSQSS